MFELPKYPQTLQDKEDDVCPYCISHVDSKAWVCGTCNAYKTFNNGEKIRIPHIVGWFIWLTLSILAFVFIPQLLDFLSNQQNFVINSGGTGIIFSVFWWLVLLASIYPVLAFIAATYEIFEFFRFNGYVKKVWRRPKR